MTATRVFVARASVTSSAIHAHMRTKRRRRGVEHSGRELTA